jgi:hypothetical protein
MKPKKLKDKGNSDILMEHPEPYRPMTPRGPLKDGPDPILPLSAMNDGTGTFKPMKKCKK